MTVAAVYVEGLGGAWPTDSRVASVLEASGYARPCS